MAGRDIPSYNRTDDGVDFRLKGREVRAVLKNNVPPKIGHDPKVKVEDLAPEDMDIDIIRLEDFHTREQIELTDQARALIVAIMHHHMTTPRD